MKTMTIRSRVRLPADEVFAAGGVNPSSARPYKYAGKRSERGKGGQREGAPNARSLGYSSSQCVVRIVWPIGSVRLPS